MLCSGVGEWGEGGGGTGDVQVRDLGWAGLMGCIVQECDSEGTVRDGGGEGAEWFVSVGVVFAWLGDDGLEYRELGTFLYTYIDTYKEKHCMYSSETFGIFLFLFFFGFFEFFFSQEKKKREGGLFVCFFCCCFVWGSLEGEGISGWFMESLGVGEG